MKEYYPDNTYKTPPGKKSSIWDFVLLRTRLLFYIRVISSIVNYNRKYTNKGLYTPALWARQSDDILKIAEECGGKFDISGIDNIRKVSDVPVVFIGNHMGLLETMVLPSLIEPIRRTTYVVKKSLIDFPVFGKIMKATNPIVVGRENPREDLVNVLYEGTNNLKKNISVILFPQSTRKPFFDRSRFNTLGIKLALRGNAKIVPIALKTDFLENGKRLKDFGKLNRKKTVYIKFGEPLELKGNGKEEHGKIIEFISENLKEWGVKVL
ncbi:MAG: lysophospholipid acyltransferase family protein [Acidobacteriota bacterium]